MSRLEEMTEEERSRTAAAARFFARLLLKECDAGLLEEMTARGLRDDLADLGLTFPQAADEDAIERLAAAYFEALVNPADGIPPVQSLAQSGTFESEPARGMREIAAAAGLSFDANAALGAPVDHLGSQLAMWADLLLRDVAAADEFHRRHLAWAPPVLALSKSEGFYRELMNVVRDFVAAHAPAA